MRTGEPVAASLAGLDGLPTQTIPLFRLPGLSSGAVVINTNLMATGQGSVTVQVQSLKDPAMTASETALMSANPGSTTQLVASPNPATIGQPVTLKATVAPASGAGTRTGSVTITIDGQAQTPVALQTSNGVALASFTTATLSVGQHTLTASYSGDSSDAPSDSNVVDQTIAVKWTAAAPTVKTVKRFGYHMQPATLVLTFSAALDPSPAQVASDYRIVTLGGRGRAGKLGGHITRVRRAVYDPTTLTVTLDTATRLDVHNRYRLTVAGTAPVA